MLEAERSQSAATRSFASVEPCISTLGTSSIEGVHCASWTLSFSSFRKSASLEGSGVFFAWVFDAWAVVGVAGAVCAGVVS